MSRTKCRNTALPNFPQSGHEYTQCFLSRQCLASRLVLCVVLTGLRKVVSTNKDWLHSCQLHRHVHRGDQTGVLTSPSPPLTETPGTAAKPNCNSILQAVSNLGTNKQNKIIIMMMQGKASRRPVGLSCCSPGRLKCVCSY